MLIDDITCPYCGNKVKIWFNKTVGDLSLYVCASSNIDSFLSYQEDNTNHLFEVVMYRHNVIDNYYYSNYTNDFCVAYTNYSGKITEFKIFNEDTYFHYSGMYDISLLKYVTADFIKIGAKLC